MAEVENGPTEQTTAEQATELHPTTDDLDLTVLFDVLARRIDMEVQGDAKQFALGKLGRAKEFALG